MPELTELERRAEEAVARKDLGAALLALMRARSMAEESFGVDSLRHAQVLDRLARLQVEMENVDVAALLCEESLSIYQRLFDPTHDEVRGAIERFVEVCVARHDLARGDRLLASLYQTALSQHDARHPIAVSVRFRRGQFHAELGDLARAREILREVAAEREQRSSLEDPEAAAALVALIKTDTALKRLSEAEDLCKRLLAVQREQYGVEYVETRRTFNLLADIRDAIDESDELDDPEEVKLPPDDWPAPPPAGAAGGAHAAAFKLSGLFRPRARGVESRGAVSVTLAPTMAVGSGASHDALAAVEALLAAQGESPQLLNSRGVIKAKRGDNEGALADFLRAMKIDKNFSKARINRFLLFISMERDDDAWSMVDNIAHSSPNDAVPHVQCAMLQRKKGYFMQALVDLSRAVVSDFTAVVEAMAPADAARKAAQGELDGFHRANAHLERSKLEDAWWECDEIASRNRKNYHAVALRGIFTGIMGNYSRAYDQIDEPGPEMGRAEALVLLVRGLLLDLLGYPEDADLEYAAARTSGPHLLAPELIP